MIAAKPWTQFNCYDILRVAADADEAAVRDAFRRVSRDSHPDRGGSHDAQVQVNLALEILCDPEKRLAHDIFWKQAEFARASSEGAHTSFESAAREPAFVDPAAMRRLWNGQNVASGRALTNSENASGLARRIHERLARDGERIVADRDARTKELWRGYRGKLVQMRAAALLVTCLAAALGFVAVFYPAAWALAIPAILVAIWKLLGRRIGGRWALPLDPTVDLRLIAHARRRAAESCERDRERQQIHRDSLAFLEELITRPTQIADPPGLVQKRLTALFFVMGAHLESVDPKRRLLLFERDGARIAVRWRHGDGVALEVDAVERIAREARAMQSAEAYLFYPPGLTHAAAERAETLHLRHFDLDAMNRWARTVWLSDHAGPPGDILAHIAALHEQLLA